MPLNSKSKGSAYERGVARTLSQWLYGNTQSLYRSRGSGSLFTRGSMLSEVGDISPIKTNLYFPFCVECKNRESGCDVGSLITKGVKSDLYKWFVQNESDASSAGLFSLLIFKQNYVPEMALFRSIGRLATGSGVSSFPLFAFRFSKGDVLYSATVASLTSTISGESFLSFLSKKGYRGYGE